MDPARMFMESLTPRPELENSQGHQLPLGADAERVRYATISGPYFKP
jgi:hypothetical protein